MVFAPGYDEAVSLYAPLLDSWVRAGFVVAAVRFPLTSPTTPGGPDESDIINQPEGLSVVIDQLVEGRAVMPAWLREAINPGEVAVAGHSDGAESAAAVSFDTCCRDPHVDAAIIMAGSELPMGRGDYFPPGSPPLLAIQGSADRINTPAGMTRLYQDDGSPKYFLGLTGSDHCGPFTGQGPAAQLVEAATVDYLDGELRHDPGGLRRLVGLASGSPAVQFESS